MKRTLLWVILLLGVTFTPWAEESSSWTLYESLDWSGRLDYLKGPKAPTDGAFLLRALEATDAARIEADRDPDSPVKKEIALRLIGQLATQPVEGALPLLSRIPRQYKDPFLRGESWVALAKLGSKTLAAELALNLMALNESGTRSRNEEIQAAYAVQAFGLLKAPEGFRAVAGAAVAWYSPASRVKESARKVLPTLVPDFEKAILPLLSDDPDLTFRDGLFQVIADGSDKGFGARAAASVLSTLVGDRPEAKADRDTVARLTLEALGVALAAPSPPASLVTPLATLLGRPEPEEIHIQSVRVLAKVDDPAAVTVLSDALGRLNSRQKSGTNTNQDFHLVRELISALGQTGKASARPVLEEVRLSDYPPGFAREAQAAADRLPR